MNEPIAAAAPETGIPDAPTFDTLAADPEIAALLDFEPVVRQVAKANGWTPAAQRIFIAWLAHYGSPTNACLEVGKARSGVDKLYKAPEADEFRASWDGAVALFERRRIAQMQTRGAGAGSLRPPTPARGRPPAGPAPLLPGQVYNEMGHPEDESSFNRRGEEARESIAIKLLRCRRALLCEISRDPGKRAAFELLTELPIDWDKARRLEPQADEPWRAPRMLDPGMVVTAENGWLGTIVPDYGPDKISALREAIDKARKKRGLPLVGDWSESDEGESGDRESAENKPNDGARPVGLDGASHPSADALAYSRDAEPDRPGCGSAATDSFDVTDSLRDAPSPPPPDHPEAPPPSRTFGLNSEEFYDAVTDPAGRPWIANGALPREPRHRDQLVIVETARPEKSR